MKHFRSLLHWVLRAISLILIIIIKAYQRFLSPYKNYQCAHHIHKGDLSCSANALHALEKENLFISLNKIFHRRKECRQIACEHGFSYQQLYLKSGLAVVALSAVTGCGGSDDGETKNNIDEPLSEVTIDVSVDKSVLPEIESDYFVVDRDQSEELANSSASIETIDSSVSLIGVSNENGDPYLSAWKHPNQDKIEITLESTAVVFFLTRPQFAGVTFTDSEAVENKIKSHSDFSKLVDLLEIEIADSPCPLDPMCSTEAMVLSDKMYDDMSFDDLIK